MLLQDIGSGQIPALRFWPVSRSQLHRRRSHLARAWDLHIPAICDKRPANAQRAGVRTEIAASWERSPRTSARSRRGAAGRPRETRDRLPRRARCPPPSGSSDPSCKRRRTMVNSSSRSPIRRPHPVDVRRRGHAAQGGAGELHPGRPVGRGQRRDERPGSGAPAGPCGHRVLGGAFLQLCARLGVLGGPGARPGDRAPARRARPFHDLGPLASDRPGHGRRPWPGCWAARCARRPCGRRAAGAGTAGCWNSSCSASPSAQLDGVPLRLTRRQLEILALLALNPDGLNLGELHARLYGDRPVSQGTLKAEMSQLRALLGGRLASRPYRIGLDVRCDVTDVLRRLRAATWRDATDRTAESCLPAQNPRRWLSSAPSSRWRCAMRCCPTLSRRWCSGTWSWKPYDLDVLGGRHGLQGTRHLTE